MSNFQFQTLAFLDNNRNRKAAAGQAVCGVTHIAGSDSCSGCWLASLKMQSSNAGSNNLDSSK